MPVSQFERSVLLFNLRVAMSPQDAQEQHDVDMTTAMEWIVASWHAGEGWMRVGDLLPVDDDADSEEEERERPNLISVQEIDWAEDGVVTMLLSHGDSQAADPALRNFRTGKIRTAGKTDLDGVAHAGHLVLSTVTHLSPSGQSRTLLERVPGIGRSAVTRLLNKMLRAEASKRKMRFVGEDGRKHACHPKLIGHGQISHEIREDIENGRLTHVEFVTHQVGPGFEEKDRVQPVSRILRHKIVRSPVGSAITDLINRMATWGRGNGYEEIQVYFNNKRTSKNQSARFSTEIADAKDLVYSRYEIIGDFPEHLEQCPEQIVVEIQEKLCALLDKESVWQ